MEGRGLSLSFVYEVSILRIPDEKGVFQAVPPNNFIFVLDDEEADVCLCGAWSSVYADICEFYDFIDFKNIPRDCRFNPSDHDTSATVLNLKTARFVSSVNFLHEEVKPVLHIETDTLLETRTDAKGCIQCPPAKRLRKFWQEGGLQGDFKTPSPPSSPWNIEWLPNISLRDAAWKNLPGAKRFDSESGSRCAAPPAPAFTTPPRRPRTPDTLVCGINRDNRWVQQVYSLFV